MKARCVTMIAAVCTAGFVIASGGWAETKSMTAVSRVKVVREYKVPFPEGRNFRPRISGDWVVGIYNTDMTNATATAQIMAYNLRTKRMLALWQAGAGWPDVNGNFATWTGKSNTQPTLRTFRGEPNGTRMPSNLLVYDLTTGAYYCPSLRTGGASYPTVCGNYVTYVGGGHIFLVDMATGDQWQLSDPNTGNRNYSASVGGDYVTWWDDNSTGTRVHIYKISSGEALLLQSDPGVKCHMPETDGKTVVWTGFKGSAGGIHAYDLATGRQGKVYAGHFPDVDNGLAVYLKPLKEGPVVYGVFPFLPGKEFRISKGTADQGPSISGNRVIWVKDNVVYCAELNLGSPVLQEAAKQ